MHHRRQWLIRKHDEIKNFRKAKEEQLLDLKKQLAAMVKSTLKETVSNQFIDQKMLKHDAYMSTPEKLFQPHVHD